jgi:hypothetical protein
MRRGWCHCGDSSAAQPDFSFTDHVACINAVEVACSLAPLPHCYDFLFGRPVVQPFVRERLLKRCTEQIFIASCCFVQRRRDPDTCRHTQRRCHVNAALQHTGNVNTHGMVARFKTALSARARALLPSFGGSSARDC